MTSECPFEFAVNPGLVEVPSQLNLVILTGKQVEIIMEMVPLKASQCNWTLDGNCNDTLHAALNPDQIDQLALSVASYVAATAILCVSAVLATPGNFLVIWVVMKTPFLRSKAVNMLIVNLCLIDLVASLLDLPLIWIILHRKFRRLYTHKWICNWSVLCDTLFTPQ